ncbi:hypothetical protein TrVFT333_006483 [Trichoderma virens FT-333]|nr:hypothetical protein TrVFT333_006483 [Trichoderma virens FT-333]
METTEEFVATTKEELAFKTAVNNALGSDVDRVLDTVTTDGGAVKKRFILHSKGYDGNNFCSHACPSKFATRIADSVDPHQDVYNYVVTGMRLPEDDNKFDTYLPRSSFKHLEIIDGEIYQQTKDTLMGITKSCREFNTNTMGKLTTAANAAITFSQRVIGLLQREKNINFKDQLNIMLDPKYKKEADIDEDFEAARKGALLDLQILTNEAEAKKKRRIQFFRSSLLSFKNDTMTRKKDVNFLIQQYLNGPVIIRSTGAQRKDELGNPHKPYASFLDERAVKLFHDYEKALENAKSKGKEMAEKHNSVRPLVWIPIYGQVRALILNTEANEAGEAWYEEIQKSRQHKSDHENILKLLESVGSLNHQFKDMESKMTTAVSALAELSGLFASQQENYDLIAQNLGVSVPVSRRMLRNYAGPGSGGKSILRSGNLRR